MWLKLPRGQLVLQRISANALQNASTSAYASKVGSNAKKDAIQRTKSAPTSDFGISIVDFIQNIEISCHSDQRFFIYVFDPSWNLHLKSQFFQETKKCHISNSAKNDKNTATLLSLTFKIPWSVASVEGFFMRQK